MESLLSFIDVALVLFRHLHVVNTTRIPFETQGDTFEPLCSAI